MKNGLVLTIEIRILNMGEINIPRDQQIVIAAIDDSELDRLIDQAVGEERSGELHRLALTSQQSSMPSTEL